MTLILTTPISAGSNSIILQDIVVPPLSTVIVDSVNILNNSTIRWSINIRNTVTHDTISQELLANVSNTNVRHSRYGIVGTLLPHLVDVVLDDTHLFLQLKIINTSNDRYVIDLIR
jgi:hypothetical protein